MNQKNAILVLIALVVAIGGYGIYGIYKDRHSVLYEQVTINKDTGQNVINTPNQKPENGSGAKQVSVIGSGKFITTAGMTVGQTTLAESLIENYVINQLGGQYSQVSILNNGFKSSGNQLSSQIRLGNSNILLNLTINYSNLTNVEVIISSPTNNTYYHYDSGTQQASS